MPTVGISIRRAPRARGHHGALAALALTAVVCAVGCADDERAVDEALRDIRGAFIAEDYAGVCSRLSPRARRQLDDMGHGETEGCPSAMRAKLSATVLSARDRIEPTIESLEVDGDRADAVLLLGGTTPTRMIFRRSDGQWLLDTLFAISGPPAADL